MYRIRDQGVSGIFGMSNQERPDLLQAIKHLYGTRVVRMGDLVAEVEGFNGKEKARSSMGAGFRGQRKN
jgi:hypothetical protein